MILGWVDKKREIQVFVVYLYGFSAILHCKAVWGGLVWKVGHAVLNAKLSVTVKGTHDTQKMQWL